MHHIRSFLDSKPWTSASVSVSHVGPLLAEAKADMQTPVATVIERTGNKQLQVQFGRYIEAVYAENHERCTATPDAAKSWKQFQSSVTFDQLFSNQLWQHCSAGAVHGLHLPLLGLESPLAQQSGVSSAAAAAAAVPSSAAFLAYRVLERTQESALADNERLWAAETLRPELKVAVSAVDALLETLTKKPLPYPLEGMSPKKGCDDLAAAMLARLEQFQRSAEEVKTAQDEIDRFSRHCFAQIASIQKKYKQQQQKESSELVVQAATSSLQAFAYNQTIKTLQTALGVLDSVKVPARLSGGKLLEERRDELSTDITRLATERVAEIEPIDGDALHAERQLAYKAAIHLDVAALLEQISSMCEQYAEANRDKGIAVSDARQFVADLLQTTRIRERKHCDALGAQETAAVSDRALLKTEPSLDRCVAAAELWKERLSELPGQVAPATAAAEAKWYEPWMDVPVSIDLVRSLEKDLARAVAEAGTPPLNLTNSSSGTHVPLSVVLTRMRPFVAALAVADVRKQGRSRKRR